ncbi:MAG: ABC transporter ATP-binding protein [Deltaproteobacteria bacterium]|nr:ABC transporter ATP-binding protein [Deltaproteobacteria bacterium]MBW1929830.1 ABC transporter ATP-binding protein [Deltaproteobacteria bacterium]MBW2024125.1 ABC transporter ATP-binding protein [Deltaproteobacteria bacterium]MBW2124384.1 ABC transporter ATP-binding protein [Deltaproteobacteria bacterium]RLB24409.1 MAG: ABC transporter ATP-binding protein [Deltaproteobacteria bacterium]
MALLEVSDVVSGYGKTDILHGVSISVEKDEIVTIIGPNGAGKSTLFKTIMGYLLPRAGKITFLGEDVTKLPPNKKVEKGIAYVPQLENVFPSLTIQENLEMGGYSKDKDKQRKGIERAFETFPILASRRMQRAKSLSGGERQMLAMSIALMTEPALLLLDEPSAGLSPKVTEEVFNQINRLHDKGIAILIIEQDAHRSLKISDRGYVLAMGQNYFDGPADSILNDEKIREAFLGG